MYTVWISLANISMKFYWTSGNILVNYIHYKMQENKLCDPSLTLRGGSEGKFDGHWKSQVTQYKPQLLSQK